MSNTLLIIEAPGKLKKIQSILPGYKVAASGGHVQKLALSGKSNLGFSVDGNQVHYNLDFIDPKAKENINRLRKMAAAADSVVLATDKDREGEFIAFCLANLLKLKDPQRVCYTEITAPAIRSALQNPRSLDLDLAHASLARAIADRSVGFIGSELLRRTNQGNAMGRVQSVALHFIATRYRQNRDFKATDYYAIAATYGEGFTAHYIGKSATALPESQNTTGDADTKVKDGEEKVEGKRLTDLAEVKTILAIARSNPHRVVSVEKKAAKKSPPRAFTTSSLLKAATTRLKLSTKQITDLANTLYQQGLITYIRTDSDALSDTFIAAVYEWLTEKDPANLPENGTVKRRRKKQAHAGASQEAHEAIRPVNIATPSSILKPQLEAQNPNLWALYLIIWKRAVASLCRPAQLANTKVTVQCQNLFFVARAAQVLQRGYSRYWNDIADDTLLPELAEGTPLHLEKVDAVKKKTTPPSLLSEATLISMLEKSGVGRPSTIGSIVSRLQHHRYIEVKKRKLLLTDTGDRVDSFLDETLPDLLLPQYTADIEQNLDQIAHGSLNWEKFVTTWYPQFLALIDGVSASKSDLCDNHLVNVRCPKCDRQMRELRFKNPRPDDEKQYFLGCTERTCDGVLFWNKVQQQWVPPLTKEQKAARAKERKKNQMLTKHDCPVCGSPLEALTYIKDGQKKIRLVCSEKKKKKCKEIVYWQTKEGKFFCPNL